MDFIVRPIVMIIIGSIMIIALFSLQYGQNAGNYFTLKYPNCVVNDAVVAISKMTNGVCDGGELNTQKCDFDGGDCFNFNLLYPGCNVDDPEKFLGNGECDGGLYNTPECKYDNGDCDLFNSYLNEYPNCTVDFFWWIGDGRCDGDGYNTTECGFDGGDCLD
eukprot:scaffold610_cov204-Chaetoceros_neogracile.AAC.3